MANISASSDFACDTDSWFLKLFQNENPNTKISKLQ